jgi:hypothetical protein
MHLRPNRCHFAAQVSPRSRDEKSADWQVRRYRRPERWLGAVIGFPETRGANRPLSAACDPRRSVRAAITTALRSVVRYGKPQPILWVRVASDPIASSIHYTYP